MKKQYRNPNQLYSEWRTTNKASMEFNDFYMNANHNPQSGANKVDVLSKVWKSYKVKGGKPFGNDAFWGVVNDKPKCLNLKSVDDYADMSKRNTTSYATHNQSYDARIRGIDLNNDDPYEVSTRPTGRDRAKRKLKEA